MHYLIINFACFIIFMKSALNTLLFCFLLLCIQVQVKASVLVAGDTSLANLNRLTKKKVYLINESRKTNVPEPKRRAHKADIEAINLQLNEIYAERRAAAILSGNKGHLDFHKKDSADRAADFDIAGLFNPELYPVESKAFYGGGSVSFLAVKHFTAPWRIYVEKTLTSKITAGLFFGHYTELNHLDKGYSTANWSYTAKSRNYTYSNFMFGLQGTYHFFNPEKPLFNLPVTKWDFYVSALAGYTLTSKPAPFLKYKAYDTDPIKDGIAYGVFPGLRYYFDERFALNAEVGFGSFGYISAGFSYKFVNSKTVIVMDKKEKDKKYGKGKGKGKKSPRKKK
jgi:hypothetical protein